MEFRHSYRSLPISQRILKRTFYSPSSRRLLSTTLGLARRVNGGKIEPCSKHLTSPLTQRVLSMGPELSFQDWGKHSIFVSTSDDPYFNLSVEDMLFRQHDSKKPLLLIYRDKPCVVIGRNQNPWKEVNMLELERMQIPFIRRRSGGGTVYHDLGNSNFSIHLPRATFDRHSTAGTVLRAIRSLGINARVNDRNDLCVGTEKISLIPGDVRLPITFLLLASCVPPFKDHTPDPWPASELLTLDEEKKYLPKILIRREKDKGEKLTTFSTVYVSGSAYKIVNNRAYHHGTMLISTKLDALGDLLRVTNKAQMVTKGVASVRSPVCNLQQFEPNVSHETFTKAIVAQFQKDYGIDEEMFLVNDTQEAREDPDIQKGIAELQTWGWAYGSTPEFTYQTQQAFPWGTITLDLRSKHGIVLECTGELSGSLDESGEITDYIMELSASLVGQRYGFLQFDDTALDKGSLTELTAVRRDIGGWISSIA